MRVLAIPLAALLAGLLFGAGLSLSGMIDPAVVLAFLDVAAIADGGWNPALALVMAGALAVAGIGFAVTRLRRGPLFAPAFVLPEKRAVDAPLLVGAAIFGVGWGLAGYCPGPAIAGLGFAPAKTWLFVAAMLAGMALHVAWTRRGREVRPPDATCATPSSPGDGNTA